MLLLSADRFLHHMVRNVVGSAVGELDTTSGRVAVAPEPAVAGEVNDAAPAAASFAGKPRRNAGSIAAVDTTEDGFPGRDTISRRLEAW